MYREVNGTRYENPHTARLEGLKQAERSKEARTKDEVDTMNFVYGANTDARQTLDPDKVVYLKSRPQAKDLNPNTTGDNAIYGFENAPKGSSSGDYKFLSPMHKAPTKLPFDTTRTYPTLEHALAASKVPLASDTFSESARTEALDAIVACEDALAAKRLGSKHLGKNDSAAAAAWRAKSLEVMGALVRDRFLRSSKHTAKLLATGNQPLVHRNDFKDHFWGVGPPSGNGSGSGNSSWGSGAGEGSNHYGKILIEVRSELKASQAMEAWVHRYCRPYRDDDVCWDVEVSRGQDRLPSDDVTVNEAVVYMGKLPQCGIRAEHPTVSRVHTVLVACQVQGPCVVDLGTVNGSFLGGVQLPPFTPTPLRSVSTTGGGAAAAAAVSSAPPPLVLARSSRSYACLLCTNVKERRAAALQAQLASQAEAAVQPSGTKGGSKSNGSSGSASSSSAITTEHTAFLANLPFTITETSLRNWLVETNPLLKEDQLARVSVPMSQDHEGQARGIAFVSTISSSSLLQVMALDGDLCEDRTVKVKRAEPPKKKDSAGRGGGSNERAKEGDYWKSKGGDGSAGGGGGGGQGGSSGVCFDFQKGKCDRGDACRFKHEDRPRQDQRRDEARRPRDDDDRDRRRRDDDEDRRRDNDGSRRRGYTSRSRSPRRSRSRSPKRRRSRSR